MTTPARSEPSRNRSEQFRKQIRRMSEENIFLFVPNIIGYVRVLFTFVSCYFMAHDHVKASLFYIVGSGLDLADGHAARFFKQSTKFGAVLDMVTDRLATTLLLVMLSVLYPAYTILFQTLIAVDIGSHWLQMYSSLLRGGASHKDDKKFNFVMALYYYRPVLFLMCAGNELFFAMLYLVYFTPGPTVPFAGSFGGWQVLLCLTAPIAVVKNCINVVQLVQAAQAIGEHDVEERRKNKS